MLRELQQRILEGLLSSEPAPEALELLSKDRTLTPHSSSRDHGIADAQGTLVPLRLSQQDLANLIGVTRESVNLALSDFRKRGLVVIEGRAFRLPRPQALEQLQ